jgi:hypothetical protein
MDINQVCMVTIASLYLLNTLHVELPMHQPHCPFQSIGNAVNMVWAVLYAWSTTCDVNSTSAGYHAKLNTKMTLYCMTRKFPSRDPAKPVEKFLSLKSEICHACGPSPPGEECPYYPSIHSLHR